MFLYSADGSPSKPISSIGFQRALKRVIPKVKDIMAESEDQLYKGSS